MNYIVVLVLFFSILLSPTYAAALPTKIWVATSDINYYDRAIDNAVDSAGNVYVLGSAAPNGWNPNDTVLVKYNPSTGRQSWSKVINLGDSEEPVKLALDPNGNPIIAVTASTATSTDLVTAKYDARSGRQLWVSRYTPNQNIAPHLRDMKVDSSGNVYIAGITWDDTGEPNGELRFTTIKYDNSGNQLWLRKFDHCSWNNSLASMTIDSSGNVYLTGDSWPCDGIETVKYDTNGNLAWGTFIARDPLKKLHAKKINVSSSGNVYIAALEEGNDFGGAKVILLDNNTGNQLSSGSYDFTYYKWSFDLDSELDANGNVLIAATIKDYNTITYDIMTLKFSDTGEFLWSATYDSGYDDTTGDLELDSNGNIYVAGLSEGSRGDAVLLKYNGNGAWQWTELYNADLWDSAETLTIDSSNNLYVSGVSWNNDATNNNLLTIKYSCPGGGC